LSYLMVYEELKVFIKERYVFWEEIDPK